MISRVEAGQTWLEHISKLPRFNLVCPKALMKSLLYSLPNEQHGMLSAPLHLHPPGTLSYNNRNLKFRRVTLSSRLNSLGTFWVFALRASDF